MNKLITTLSILLITTASYAQTYTVERVIDGDTLKLTNGKEVQLIGIKAPEDEEMGQEATEFVKSLGLEGKEVRLEFDVQKRDKYGRLLAFVYVRLPNETLEVLWRSGLFDTDLLGYECPASDGLPKNIAGWWEDFVIEFFLNARIIKSGYAQPMTIPPNVKYAELFEELYEEAREAKRGLWKELLIQILPEHQKCQENDDCILINSDCTQCARSGCTIPDTAINKKHKIHYRELHSECSKEAPCYQCTAYQTYKSSCEDGRCIKVPDPLFYGL